MSPFPTSDNRPQNADYCEHGDLVGDEPTICLEIERADAYVAFAKAVVRPAIVAEADERAARYSESAEEMAAEQSGRDVANG